MPTTINVMMKTINIPVEGMLTPFEQNELFDYLMDYFIYTERANVFLFSKGKITPEMEQDFKMCMDNIDRAKKVIIPLLEKTGMKGKKIKL